MVFLSHVCCDDLKMINNNNKILRHKRLKFRLFETLLDIFFLKNSRMNWYFSIFSVEFETFSETECLVLWLRVFLVIYCEIFSNHTIIMTLFNCMVNDARIIFDCMKTIRITPIKNGSLLDLNFGWVISIQVQRYQLLSIWS